MRVQWARRHLRMNWYCAERDLSSINNQRIHLAPQCIMASSPRSTKTLFSKDGISLYATTLSSSVDAGSDDDDNDGIILTLALNRQQEKNVVNPTLISLLIEALDTIDTHPMLVNTNNKSLIITGLSLEDDGEKKVSKFFSNGLDLEWMLRANNTTTSNGNQDGASQQIKSNPTSQMIESFNAQVLARVLTLPMRTIAAINGHCIGAGLFLALACDYRIMRTKRGFIQWPEAKLGMRLTKGFAELSKAKVGYSKGSAKDHHVLREGILTAKMYNSSEALASGIIDAECPIEELYEHAFQLAKDGLPETGMKLEYFDPKGYTEVKMEMYTDAYRALKFGRVGDLPHSRI